MKKKIIVDTNFLLIPGQFKVDIFSEIHRIMDEPYELCMVEETVKELDRLIMSGNTKEKYSAKLGLVLAQQKSLKRLDGSRGNVSADDAIVSAADNNTLVATQDKALRERARGKGAMIIGLRQKRYLVVI